MRKLAMALALFFPLALQADDVVVLRAARLIDGTGAAPLSNGVVVVTGSKITAVGSNLPAPAGAKVIDL
ncbi:MAG TPA: amidohydrolase family protein, partial [Thermoanaerobaculia bacterium]